MTPGSTTIEGMANWLSLAKACKCMPCRLLTRAYNAAQAVDLSDQEMNTWDITLSNSDLEMLGLLSRGHNNKEIGEMLSLADSTVKNHLSMIFRKMGVRDRTQAALLAHDLALFNSEVREETTEPELEQT